MNPFIAAIVALVFAGLSVMSGAYWACGTVVTTTAMEPTLHEGSVVLVSRAARNRNFKRGDIILFRVPDEDAQAVRRVIGLPGETISLDGGVLTVNGQAVKEPWLEAANTEGPRVENPVPDSFPQTTVDQDKYFVLSDFRKGARDSRAFGQVPKNRVLGRVWTLFGLTL